ncbi:DUF3748 domain-containing protein [Klebsiella pneumoniae]|nr:DUF3748 domain-containing protein [Klebsiella pneumoniae]
MIFHHRRGWLAFSGAVVMMTVRHGHYPPTRPAALRGGSHVHVIAQRVSVSV